MWCADDRLDFLTARLTPISVGDLECPQMVDTQLCRSTSSLTLVFRWCHVPDTRMQPLSIVEDLDTVEHLNAGDFACWKRCRSESPRVSRSDSFADAAGVRVTLELIISSVL